jgi:WD40 repeat protein
MRISLMALITRIKSIARIIFFTLLSIGSFESLAQTRSPELLWKINAYSPITATSIAPNGKYVAIGTGGGVVQVYHISGELIWENTLPYKISSISIANENYLVAVSYGKNVVLLNQAGQLWNPCAFDNLITNVEINKNNTFIIATSIDHNIYFINTTTGQINHDYKTDHVIYAMSSLVENDIFVVGSYDGSIICLSSLGRSDLQKVNQVYSLTKSIKYANIKINSELYCVSYIEGDKINGIIVHDSNDNIVQDFSITKDALFVTGISGFFPLIEQKELHFDNYLNQIQSKLDILQFDASTIIPISEILGTYAIDIGPRVIAELIKISFSGGISTAGTIVSGTKAASDLTRISSKITIDILKNTITDMSKNPKKYIMMGMVDILNTSIQDLNVVKSIMAEYKNKEIYDFDTINRINEKYLDAVANGFAAIASYQGGMATPVEIFSEATKNFFDQAVGEDVLSGLFKTVEIFRNTMSSSKMVQAFYIEQSRQLELLSNDYSLAQRTNECKELTNKILEQISRQIK